MLDFKIENKYLGDFLGRIIWFCFVINILTILFIFALFIQEVEKKYFLVIHGSERGILTRLSLYKKHCSKICSIIANQCLQHFRGFLFWKTVFLQLKYVQQ